MSKKLQRMASYQAGAKEDRATTLVLFLQSKRYNLADITKQLEVTPATVYNLLTLIQTAQFVNPNFGKRYTKPLEQQVFFDQSKYELVEKQLDVFRKNAQKANQLSDSEKERLKMFTLPEDCWDRLDQCLVFAKYMSLARK